MNLLGKSGAWIRGLAGWRRALFAFAAGLLSALGFAPVGFFPALLVGFAALVLLLEGADSRPHPLRSGFIAGWCFAFGQFFLGWHWIGYAFMVDPGAHLWQLPFAITLLPAAMAIYAGIACALALYFWQDGPARFLVFAMLYTMGEWLRGHLFTGFPWNLPAYSWGAEISVLQCMAVIGAFGLSFLTVLLGASLADFGRRACKVPLVMMLLFVLIWTGGALRLADHPISFVPGVSLRIVQPDIPQREKDQSRFFARNWQRLLTLSAMPGNPTHIIWPEAAPPNYIFQQYPASLDEIGLLTGDHRTLITGEVRAQRTADKLSFYNSLFIFGPNSAPVQVYDKFHLVPFGEYVPYADILNKIGITKLTDGQEGFASGDGPHTYKISGAPEVGPLICYEIIFPAAVVSNQPGNPRPGWLVNVTDDSWFGPWAGPYQHFLIARARAIEEALPVARAANTGISGVIDPYGRVTARLGLGEMGVLDARLPRAASQSTYARYGDWTLLLLLVSATILAFALARK